MRESEFWGPELKRREAFVKRAEAPEPRDDYRFSRWREDASQENLDLLEFYGTYLPGQYAGMTSQLSLEAIRTALEMDEVPRCEWGDMTQRILYLHSLIEQIRKD